MSGSGYWSFLEICLRPPKSMQSQREPSFFRIKRTSAPWGEWDGWIMLRVSALHYSAGDQVAGGFRTVASARALCQPTSCGSEYFYNQCPRVRNLIGTERSLNRSERRVKKEAS